MNSASFTLLDLIEHNGRMHGSKLAFGFGEHRITHSDYGRRTARLAAGLAKAGVVAGDCCAILSDNCLEYVDLLGALGRLGAIMVPINCRLSQPEVAHVINDTCPKILLVSPAYLDLVTESEFGEQALYLIGSRQGQWQSSDDLYVDGTVSTAVADDDALMIIYTAASDGRPKGAILSHRNLVNISALTRLAWRLGPEDANVGVLPLFHVTGIDMLLAVQQAGGATWLMPRFDAQRVVRHITDDAASVIATFPPMLERVLDAASDVGDTLTALRIVTGIDSSDTILRLQAAHQEAVFWSAYGQTETSGFVSLSPFDKRPGSVGWPITPSCVGIIDDTGRLVNDGVTGEIVVCGPMVFRGYWPHGNGRRDRWHRTGDLGRIDADGYLWFSGPAASKTLIKTGGENVYPSEVERVILEHPAIVDAVVFGVPDPEWGEIVHAICVQRPGYTMDPEALISFVGERIARYKKPRRVEFVLNFPQSPAGIVDRVAVQAAFWRSESEKDGGFRLKCNA